MRLNLSYWWESRFSIFEKLHKNTAGHRFDGFFRFFNWFFKAFLLNRFKNLRAQFGLYQKRAGVRTPWTHPPSPHPPLDARLNYAEKTINTMQLELYLAEQKTGSCWFIQINVSPRHVEFSVIFHVEFA